MVLEGAANVRLRAPGVLEVPHRLIHQRPPLLQARTRRHGPPWRNIGALEEPCGNTDPMMASAS